MPKSIALSLIQRISTSSALTPLLAVSALLVISISATAFSSGYIPHILCGFFGFIILFFCYVFHHFMKVDPNRLHSENFQTTARREGLMLDDRSKINAGETILEQPLIPNKYIEAE